MRADVLIPRSSWRLTDRASLYSYRVPAHLADQIQLGQVVAVPFGERETAGVIWSLDASDDAADSDADDETFPLRALSSLLLDAPALSPVQRALAEWMASYYAAPLATAVRLMLPPGLARGIRYTLRPTDADNNRLRNGIAPTIAAPKAEFARATPVFPSTFPPAPRYGS